MEDFYKIVKAEAESMLPALREIRRDLHAHPETAWLEIRTTSIIVKRLKELGYKVLNGTDVCKAEDRMGLPADDVLEEAYQRAIRQGADKVLAEQARGGFTGAIGFLDCGDGPVIALRFDIDALPLFEDKGPDHLAACEGFCSVNEGNMHACGHDGHITIGLAVAELLMKHRSELKGKIKLIFQPAEEGVRGARSIVAHGHLDDVDYLIANHMGHNGGNGYQIGLTYGSTLATSKLDIFFQGKPSHAGIIPEKGDNALLAAATAVLNLHAIPRSSGGDTRINVGTLHAGTGRNVICDRAKLEVEVRGATTEVNAYLVDYAERIAKGSALMHGCSYTIKLQGSAESLQSHPDMVRYCEHIAKDKLGLNVTPPSNSAGASEDCAYMMNRVHSHGGKGIYFNTLSKGAGQFHGNKFDFDEDCMPAGISLFCAMVYSLMNEEQP